MKNHCSRTAQKKRPTKGKPSGKQARPDYPDVFERYIGKKAPLVALGLIAGIAAYVFWDYLLLHRLYVFKDIGADTYNQFYPFMVHVSNYLRTDGIPRWSFNTGMGQNIFPGNMNSPFYLFFNILPRDSIPYWIIYIEVFKLLLAGLIFYAYLRMISLSRYTAVMGSVLFVFSGFMIVGSGWYEYTATGVYVAFLLFSFEKLYKENQPLYFPLAVFLFSYSPFELYTYGLFLLLYSVVRFLDEQRWNSRKYGLLFLKMAGLGTVGVAIGTVFTVSQVMQMLQSPRVGGHAGHFHSLKTVPMFALENFSILKHGPDIPFHHLKTIVCRMFSSDLLGTGSNYRGWYNYLEAPVFFCGLLTLLLVPQAFSSYDKKRKCLYGAFLGLWLFIVIFPYFRYAYNLFTGDYYKMGISFIVTLVFLFFGLKGLDSLDRAHRPNPWLLAGSYGGLMALLYGVNYNNGQGAAIIQDDCRTRLAIFLTIYTGALFLMRAPQLKNAVKILLLPAVVVELAMLSHTTANERVTMTCAELREKIGFNDYSVEAVKYLKSIDNGFYRVNKTFFSGICLGGSLNDAQIQDYYGTPSYSPANQLQYINFLAETGVLRDTVETDTKWSFGLINHQLLLSIASVKYNLEKKRFGGLYQAEFDSIARFGDVTVEKNRYFLPLGFTYDRCIGHRLFLQASMPCRQEMLYKAFIADDGDSAAMNGFPQLAISDTDGPFTLDTIRLLSDLLRRDTMVIERHSQNMIRGAIHCSQRKMVFFSIPFDAGWHAFVDNREMTLRRINVGFMGLPLGPGDYRIELRFVPPYLAASLCGSTFGVALYFGMLFFILYGRRRRAIADSSIQADNPQQMSA